MAKSFFYAIAALAERAPAPAETGECGAANPAAELANLLFVDFQKQICAMAGAVCRGLQIFDAETSAGNGCEDPQQRALCVAIVDVKCVHGSCSHFSKPLIFFEQHLR